MSDDTPARSYCKTCGRFHTRCVYTRESDNLLANVGRVLYDRGYRLLTGPIRIWKKDGVGSGKVIKLGAGSHISGFPESSKHNSKEIYLYFHQIPWHREVLRFEMDLVKFDLDDEMTVELVADGLIGLFEQCDPKNE